MCLRACICACVIESICECMYVLTCVYCLLFIKIHFIQDKPTYMKDKI